jgi:hypothetical protein
MKRCIKHSVFLSCCRPLKTIDVPKQVYQDVLTSVTPQASGSTGPELARHLLTVGSQRRKCVRSPSSCAQNELKK